MLDLAKSLISTAVALGFVFVVLVTGGDRTVLVPPPEAVAEQFTRQIATKRYDRASHYVDKASGITEINIRLAGEALHATAGAVDAVEGEPGRINGDRATASAVLMTAKAGRVRYMFQLARVQQLWKIVEWTAP
jgi:hypothetical protein